MKYLLQNVPIQVGPNQFACPYCSRVQRKRAEMIRHIRVHTGEKPFICLICGYKTNQNSALTTHVKRKHTNIQQKF